MPALKKLPATAATPAEPPATAAGKDVRALGF
jgi:hypothetical protein